MVDISKSEGNEARRFVKNMMTTADNHIMPLIVPSIKLSGVNPNRNDIVTVEEKCSWLSASVEAAVRKVKRFKELSRIWSKTLHVTCNLFVARMEAYTAASPPVWESRNHQKKLAPYYLPNIYALHK